MKFQKINLKVITRTALCLLLALVMLSPLDGEAARKRTRTKATTTASTKKKTSRKTAGTSRRRTQRSNKTQTVTQATQQVAINASSRRGTPSSSESGKSESNLLKLQVQKPDLEEIRTATLNPKHKYYFPKLMKKYLSTDTVMTPEEFRYLYLGYMFQEDYDPYRTSPYSDITEELREKPANTRAELDTIIRYADKAFKDNPFDLRTISVLVHVLKERKKLFDSRVHQYRLEQLLGAIKSTGTGEDPDNAWFVIYPMHEYDMLQLLGYEATDMEYIEPGFDYLAVQPDGTINYRNPAKGFYFNVQVPQQQYELKHPEDAESEEAEEMVEIAQETLN